MPRFVKTSPISGILATPASAIAVEELIGEIRKILGTDREWRVASIGVGNLGRALLGYRDLNQQGFRIVDGL